MNEQTQFKIDTSGYVHKAPYDPINGWPGCYRWSDLSPFQQGAVEAAMREFNGQFDPDEAWGFRHLRPGALQRIMADCERFKVSARELGLWNDTASEGAHSWAWRQAGRDIAFPPLTISLAEDGLIHLSEVAS